MPKNITNITGVSLCQKTGIIRIFRSTIKELGDPKYIRFLLIRRKELWQFRQPVERKRSAFVCLNIIQRTGILKYVAFKC